MGDTTKLAIVGGVILLAVVGGFFAWKSVNGGVSGAEAEKLSKPIAMPASATSLRPPGASGAPPSLPSQGGPSLVPPGGGGPSLAPGGPGSPSLVPPQPR